MPIRAAIADDSLIVREGLELILTREPEIEIVASCADFPEVREAVERERPDVVLTDIRMPPTMTDEGIRLATSLRQTHPEVGVILLSQYAEPHFALALLENGSERRGYLLKERIHDRQQLREAIQAVARGDSMIDPKIVDGLLAARVRDEESRLSELTPREREVLAEIARGGSNSAIAESLVLTKRAVEKHINSIFLKLDLAFADDVSKRVKAALLFLAEAGEPDR